ncbi:hypothetical protein Tco_0776981 [Tanacetum coccineum]
MIGLSSRTRAHIRVDDQYQPDHSRVVIGVTVRIMTAMDPTGRAVVVTTTTTTTTITTTLAAITGVPVLDTTKGTEVSNSTDLPVLIPSSLGYPLRVILTLFVPRVDVDTQESVVVLLVLASNAARLVIFSGIARRTLGQCLKKTRLDAPYLARSIRRIGLDSLECPPRSQSISDIIPNSLYILYLRIVIFMDTAYGSSQIRRIKNWSNALSCEVQALIRRISLVGYDVLPLSQPKAPTAKKPKKKKIPSSTQPKVSNDSREMNPPSTTTHLQATEELVVTVVPIQSLEASVTAEVQDNQLKAADTTEVPEKIVEKEEVAEEQTLEIPTVAQLLDEVNKAAQETPESPYDTESEIKVVKSFFTSHLSEVQDQTMNDYEESAGIQEDSDSDLQSMPDDDLRSVSGFEVANSDDTDDNEVSHSAHALQDDIASAERQSLLDHMDHICEEVNSLYLMLEDLESSISQKVSDEIQSSLPALVTNALKEQLPGILSATLKDSEQKVVKQLNRQFNISHVTQSNRFVTLQKELSKVIKSEVAKKLQDVNDLLESAGEHQTAKNITPPKPTPETQGEIAYKESTLPVSEIKVNKESSMVLYESEKKNLVDLTTTEQDSEDDDDLDKQPLSKRFKIMHPIPSKPQPSVKQFIGQLFGTTSSKFSPTPPRETTPPRDESKGKGIATKETPKDIMPFMEEGGSVPKILNLKSFILSGGTLSQEKFMAQLKEMKRLADLKE